MNKNFENTNFETEFCSQNFETRTPGIFKLPSL